MIYNKELLATADLIHYYAVSARLGDIDSHANKTDIEKLEAIGLFLRGLVRGEALISLMEHFHYVGLQGFENYSPDLLINFAGQVIYTRRTFDEGVKLVLSLKS